MLQRLFYRLRPPLYVRRGRTFAGLDRTPFTWRHMRQTRFFYSARNGRFVRVTWGAEARFIWRAVANQNR